MILVRNEEYQVGLSCEKGKMITEARRKETNTHTHTHTHTYHTHNDNMEDYLDWSHFA
jgi:hypothetical protein